MDAPVFVLSTSDLTFLRAVRRSGVEPTSAFWMGLAPAWRVAMRSAWEEHFRRIDPRDAAATLAGDHRDEALPDPRHIHTSWYVRALRDESDAVRQAVAFHMGEPLGSRLRSALNLGSQAGFHHEPHPEALTWVLDFWTERLVGGPPASSLDPIAIRVLTRLSRPDILRLMVTCGRVKLADPVDRSRRELADQGRVTIGRLLTLAEPYRTRWAVQHLPYEMAKLVRAGGVPPVLDAQIDQESRVLQMARERLRADGWSDPIGEDSP